MEIKIENNIAILTEGGKVRKIDLTKDYMSEVENIVIDLKNKIEYYENIKKQIYQDKEMILNYLLKGETKNANID